MTTTDIIPNMPSPETSSDKSEMVEFTRDVPPWSGNFVFRAFFIGYMVLPLLVTNAFLIWRPGEIFTDWSPASETMVNHLLGDFFWLALLVYLSLRYGIKPVGHHVGLAWEHPWRFYAGETVRLCLGILATIVLITLVANWLFPGPMMNPLENVEGKQQMTVIAIAILIAPILEEIVFRGILQSTLKHYFSPWGAIIFTSIIFTVMHVSYEGWSLAQLYVISLSFWLGIFRERTGSVFPGMVGHLLNNIAASLYFVMA